MNGFIGWIRNQPRYSDLASDAGACRNLKGLITEMHRCKASTPAWMMLFDSLYRCPITLPLCLYRETFNPLMSVPYNCKMDAVLIYAGLKSDTTALNDDVFNDLCESIKSLKTFDPENADKIIDQTTCSNRQMCVLMCLTSYPS